MMNVFTYTLSIKNSQGFTPQLNFNGTKLFVLISY